MKLISVVATEYDCVDVQAASCQGVAVTNVPTYSTYFTAQTTFALLLELTNRVTKMSETTNKTIEMAEA